MKWFKRQPHKLEIRGFESLGPHPIINIGVIMVDKYKSSFLNNCYEWLFSEEERQPISYICIFFMIITLSTVTTLFIVAIDRHVQGWVNYLWN